VAVQSDGITFNQFNPMRNTYHTPQTDSHPLLLHACNYTLVDVGRMKMQSFAVVIETGILQLNVCARVYFCVQWR
jgi:hypothetical protein